MPRKLKKWLANASATLFGLALLAALSAWLWSDGGTTEDAASLQEPARMPAQSNIHDDELFFSAKGTDDRNVAGEALNKTGVKGLRARKVKFNSEPLRNAKRPGDRLVRFQLFSDTVFMVRFFEPSPQLNRRAEFVGQVEGDPDSRVQIWATQSAITGELVTAGRTFRFVPASGNFHYIIEIDSSH